MDTHTTPKLSWKAKSQVDHNRGGTWYIISGIFFGFMVMYGIVFGEYTVAVVFLLIPGVFYLVRNEAHREHEVRILEEGCEFDGVLTPWNQLKEFWILKGPGYYELHITPINNFSRDTIVQTGEIDPLTVRDTLLQFLPQATGKREKILDAIIRFCKL